MRLGDHRTRMLYVVLLVGAFVSVPFVAGLGGRPLGALALAAILFAAEARDRGAVRARRARR